MKLLKLIFILSILGIILSSYSLYHHYSTSEGVCNINDKFSCDVVNRSIYSEFFGIPVAFIGLLGYLLIFLLSFLMIRNVSNDFKKLLFILSLVGLFFTIYLTYIEAFKLYTFCPLCLISALLILLITVFSYIINKS